jgi:tRNA modification GTPase
VLFVADATDTSNPKLEELWPEYFQRNLGSTQSVTLLLNKIDLSGHLPGEIDETTLAISVKDKSGFDALASHLQAKAGYLGHGEGLFSARRRHLIALTNALTFVQNGIDQLKGAGAGELLAEDLRQAQNELSEITGQFTSDDLLGRIFSSFCIGK